ncbi:DUF2163 domain-containing protein [Rhodobacter sp. KR11]|uniref:DUF2163 domain-containing protein n=1 Tax=Rhodobacter sp. KR11 TaxID=2974588 RepID=UPI002221710F|nr:DUF2163 domain-containing protein [Rhodobacter sp. KR11]MCW1920813.1 DUF2163 domain-containing protein [Rhodobacter sp. KR11]
MKTFPAGLQAHLDSGTSTLAWCWKVARQDGAVFGFTDHDVALSFAGTTFEPESGFVPSEIRSGQDFGVDAQDVQGAISSDAITETDILDGRWDNAEVEVWRVNWASTDQRVLLRRGNIGDIRRGRTSFVAEVRSLAHWLNQTVGRTFQFYCDADLGDARCGVNLSLPTRSAAGSVGAAIGDRGFSAALSGYADDLFALGVVSWTTGANAGRKTEVAAFASGTVTLFEAPVRPISVGDGFLITAGCDKQFETCRTKFANGVNFRGFPHIPGDDAVMRYPNRGDANNGAPLA